MALFETVNWKLDKALREADKPQFENWEVKQTWSAGYRQALRDIAALEPKEG